MLPTFPVFEDLSQNYRTYNYKLKSLQKYEIIFTHKALYA